MRYLTSEAGAIGFQNYLKNNGFNNVMNPVEVKISNKVFHYTIQAKKDDKVFNFYCLFKHDFFYTFPDKFKEFFVKYPNLNSAGESINFDRLIYASNNGMNLIFIYESGFFYEIEPIEILKVHSMAKEFYPKGYNLESPIDEGFIREQKIVNKEIHNGFITMVKERTVSFPIKSLGRFLA